MTVRFRCARCGQGYAASREQVGRRARCRACGLVQAVPEPLGSPSEPSSYDLARGPTPQAPPPLARPEPPPRSERDRRPARGESLRAFFGEASHVQGLSVLLVALSLADLIMTYLLLRTSPRFYESNPVALWVFRQWNIAGMTTFKFLAIGTAIAIGEYIERRRPGWGKFVLLVGCVAAAGVFWHGLKLYADSP
jgi:Domain of unknown function (DUF5658)